MKNNLTQSILTVTLILFIVAILSYALIHGSKDIETGSMSTPDLSSSQKKYVENKEEIVIGVDENLLYLMDSSHGKKNYLYECMKAILSPAGLKPVLIPSHETHVSTPKVDCNLIIVTPKYRECAKNISYTAPIFQIEGALFTNIHAKDNNDNMAGYVVRDHITDRRLEDVTVDSKKPKFFYGDTNEVAAERALAEELSFVIGDVDAIHSLHTYSDSFLQQEDVLYRRNVCLVVPSEEDTLYSILNAAVHSTDRHQLTYNLAEKWFDGNAPVYMKNDHSDVYFLIVILFAAVLFAFFIYYFTNRNMYRELSDRMRKLTESRKELQTTFNGVGYHLAELDLDGRILDINKALREHLVAKGQNVDGDVDCDRNGNTSSAGNFIWDLLGFDEEAISSLRQALADAKIGNPVAGPEITVGSKIYSIDIFPIEGARGKVEKLLFVGMDITGERMAERQMLQDNKMIAVGQLAAGVAHEIRNPLGIIRNYCYVIKNFTDEKVRFDAVEQIEKAVDSSNKIITNLLGFSRNGPGYLQPVNVHDRIQSIVTIAAKSASSDNVDMYFSCEEGLMVNTNPEALNIILINLVQNAVDAISGHDSRQVERARGKVHIDADVSDKDLVVKVKDTGCGMEDHVLEEIFNPFYTTKGTHGTGLGLYIVYNEIEKLKGTIHVTSQPGTGTEFTFTLPGAIEDRR